MYASYTMQHRQSRTPLPQEECIAEVVSELLQRSQQEKSLLLSLAWRCGLRQRGSLFQPSVLPWSKGYKMGNFTKLGNTAGVIFTAMWAWIERPEVIKSHAWRIRGFIRWSPAEIRIYSTPLRHWAIGQVQANVFLSTFQFLLPSRHPLLEVK